MAIEAAIKGLAPSASPSFFRGQNATADWCLHAAIVVARVLQREFRFPIAGKGVARGPIADFRDPCSALERGEKSRNRAFFKTRGFLRLAPATLKCLGSRPECQASSLCQRDSPRSQSRGRR